MFLFLELFQVRSVLIRLAPFLSSYLKKDGVGIRERSTNIYQNSETTTEYGFVVYKILKTSSQEF